MKPAFAMAALGTLLSAAAVAQTPAVEPAFEVASVKKNTTGEKTSGDMKGDRLTMFNMPMVVLVARAYGVSNDRVVGPAWLYTDGFDIVAKVPPDTREDALWPMLRGLLAERFKLQTHRDDQPVAAFALVVAKGGPKLRESPADSQAKETCGMKGMAMTCQSRKSSMADLARNLHRWSSMDWFGLPIVDQTGLTAVYDFDLTWTMTRGRDDAVEPPGLSIFDALQAQLGLKLEQRKVPLDRIVIDRIARIPTEN